MSRVNDLWSGLRTGHGLMAAVVIVLGVVSIVVGIVFVAIGATTQSWLKEEMRAEQITLGVPDAEIDEGEVIDTMAEAQTAGDIVRGHRHKIAPTYGDLLGGEQFDPSEPQQLVYAQALNLENYLYLAAASFGLTNLAIGAGVGLMLVGIALILLAVLVTFWRSRSRPADDM